MAKSPKLDLLEKISEMKAWQLKQQEKLLLQQKEKQSMLNRRQKQDIIKLPSRESIIGGRLSDQDGSVRDKTAFRIQDSRISEDDDMGHTPGNVSLDEIPIKSPNLQFEELLESKLQEREYNLHDGNELKNIVKPKRQFLKKGEGLKRFRMKSKTEFMKRKPATINNEPHAFARESNSNATSSTQNRNISSGRISDDKSEADVIPLMEQVDKGICTKRSFKSTESSTWSNVLNQVEQECSTKLEKMPKQQEIEDLKLFELLEQMAVDSSFCSTSSTLLGFMESPIISTPLKAILEQRIQLKDLKSMKHLPFGMDTSDEETEQTVSSSESYSSENDTIENKPKFTTQGSPKVHFSDLVEEREYGNKNFTYKRPLINGDDFKDTEVWSDSDEDMESSEAIESVKATDNVLPDKKQEKIESSSLPDPVKVISNNPTHEAVRIESGCVDNATEIMLKSELLHKRLAELEQEIKTFRKENQELSHKKQLQKQAEEKWKKEKSEMEKKLKEREEEIKKKALEDHKKFNREKRMFEANSKKTCDKNLNYQEVEVLQKKLTELQLEFRQKERKNASSYNRISSRVKALEKENSELKDEIMKLKKEKEVEHKRFTARLIGNRKCSTNTKALHEINEKLTLIPPVVTKELPAGGPKSSLMEEAVLIKKRECDKVESENVSLQRTHTRAFGNNLSDEDVAENDKRRDLKETVKAKSGREIELADRTSTILCSQVPSKESDGPFPGRKALREEDAINNFTAQTQSLQQGNRATTYPLEKTNSDGSLEIRYENGNFKKISPDGLNVKLFYFNGDVKETLSDGTIKYYYSETRTWHTTFPDGLEILEFPNGQVERHFDGTVEVAFPDGTVRIIHADGKEELKLPDGTNVITDTTGNKIISFPNGQKEYQTNDFKKRVYPDGTVKIVYSDGVQETRYSNGRVRLRDSSGSLLMDSER